MSFAATLPRHLCRPREKVFAHARVTPLDRNAKARLMVLAHQLARRTAPGRAYGALSAKAVAVLRALLYDFHNSKDGRCFPSYESIAAAAACARSTVAEAIKALEATGLLSWVNRIARIRVKEPNLFGRLEWRTRIIRTSNAYSFRDPGAPAPRPSSEASKSEKPTGPLFQEDSSLSAAAPDFPPGELGAAMAKLWASMQARKEKERPTGATIS